MKLYFYNARKAETLTFGRVGALFEQLFGTQTPHNDHSALMAEIKLARLCKKLILTLRASVRRVLAQRLPSTPPSPDQTQNPHIKNPKKELEATSAQECRALSLSSSRLTSF